MTSHAKIPSRTLESFLSRLSELVDNLPSQETKSQIDEELEVLISFLQDFQRRLKSLPALEDTEGMTSTIETLRDYVRVAASDPVMSRVLGFTSDKETLKRSSGNSPAVHDRREGIAVAKELKGLSYEEVERKLANGKKYRITMLRHIGEELGLILPSKSTRASIVEKITKKVDNLRGYDYLRRGGD